FQSGTVPTSLRTFLGRARCSVLRRMKYCEYDHCRAFSMTAQRFERHCNDAGLQCIGQEVVNWRSARLIDCLSLFTPAESDRARDNRIVRNPDFMVAGRLTKQIAPLYSVSSALDCRN